MAEIIRNNKVLTCAEIKASAVQFLHLNSAPDLKNLKWAMCAILNSIDPQQMI